MLFAKFDGTGRVPRPQQDIGLHWINDNLNKYDVFALQSPVGSGKSAMARAIQLAFGAHIITPSNILVDQYGQTYPNVNALKGRKHYFCNHFQESCVARPTKGCGKCPYQDAKKRAYGGEHTFFNPMSLLVHLRQGMRRPDTVVVDEAHQLTSMLMLMCGKTFRYSQYKFDKRVENEVFLHSWLDAQLSKALKLQSAYRNKGNIKKVQELQDEIENLTFTRDAFADDPGNYCVWLSHGKYRNKPETYLHVQPIRPPAHVTRELLGYKRVILLSGTLFKCDVEDLIQGDHRFGFLDLPSAIPKDMRPIFYRPAPFQMNKDVDPRRVVGEIEKILQSRPGLNTIIHVPYSWVPKLLPHFRHNVIHNTPENKDAKVAEFRRNGGIFLAAGCGEGLDLRGDVAKVNIIPHMLFANLGDPIVRKRRDAPGGRVWYLMQAIKTLIQQYGRTSRDETDYSETYVLEPQFAQVVNELNRHDKTLLPKSFTEAIAWSGS